MNYKPPNNEDSDENSDTDSLYQFRNGTNWQQLLLYIYKHNKIVFKRQDFRDHCEEVEKDTTLSPDNRTQDDSYFNMEESKYHRDSFITNDQTRKESEINLVDNHDTSLTPVRPYDECIRKFIEDIEEEFELEDDDNNVRKLLYFLSIISL